MRKPYLLRLYPVQYAVFLLSVENRAYAIIDPGTVALLGAISASAKQTVSTLKDSVSLLELSDEMRKTLSDRGEDADSMSELFEEISPTGEISDSQRESLSSFKEYRERISSVNEPLEKLDGIKWDAKYLKMRMDHMDPSRLSSLVRGATRAIRLGKRIARLLPKTNEQQTAQNTEILKDQNYAIGKAVIDIRSELRALNEREAKKAVDGSINTINAIEQMNEAFDRREKPWRLK